jgi:hypothetical protein
MHDMSQQYQDMYTQEFPSNRSPGSNRYASNLLHRQPSRQFDSYGGGQMQHGLYTQEDHASGRFDSSRYDRVNPQNAHSNYSYDSQTWNYPGQGVNGNININGANTMG